MINCEFENGGKAKLRHAVADTLVIKDGKILLNKRAEGMLEGGKWSLAGGFMERGETIKQAVKREVLEETGWEVKDITLMTVIDEPDRPNEDRQNIDFVFFATATKKVSQPDHESSEQKWFDLGDLPRENEIAFDHADSIKLYKNWLRQKFTLPKIG